MKIIFEDVSVEDVDKLVNVSNGILKAMRDEYLRRLNAEELGEELDDTYLTEDQIYDTLCFNQVVIDFLNLYLDQ